MLMLSQVQLALSNRHHLHRLCSKEGIEAYRHDVSVNIVHQQLPEGRTQWK